MKFLVAVSIGPVQEFIAAARRTSDLWAGSQLLIDLAKTLAQSLEGAGATLIFPADSGSDGPNKILAQLEADDANAVASIVEDAKNAARKEFYRRFQNALAKLFPAQRAFVLEERADVQLDSFLELFAAWVPLRDDYQSARRDVDRLLAGRKALRDFACVSQDDAGVPKSSLDPSRAGVLRRFVEGVSSERPLRLKKSEVLDAISLLKRIEGIEGHTRGVRVLDTTSAALRALERGAWCRDEDDPRGEEQPKVPYYAILIADGDKMGERIGQMETPDEHIAFSRTLADFAGGVQSVVQRHDGFLIYAGGDDVVALLPVVSAIACARQLAQQFHSQVGATLSAGVAIVHHKEPLGRALEYARAAERAAKRERNSLAVALHTRGGVPLTVAAQWNSKLDDWATWLDAYRKRELPRGAAYELAALAREWPNIRDEDKHWTNERSAERLRGEAWRIWKRKFEGRAVLALPEYATASAEALDEFAWKLTIARFLSAGELNER